MTELGPVAVKFHVRCPARCSADEHLRRRTQALERTTRELAKQGYQFQCLEARAPRGPLPVVPIKGFPKRPVKIKRTPGQASAPPPPDDALWRVSTLPNFGPQAPHLMTDEVDWEYAAIFLHSTIRTEHLEHA